MNNIVPLENLEMFERLEVSFLVPRQNSIPAGDSVGSPYEHRISKPGSSGKSGGDVLWSLVPASCERVRQYIEEGAGGPSQSQWHRLRQPGRIDDAVHRVYRAK